MIKLDGGGNTFSKTDVDYDRLEKVFNFAAHIPDKL